jgi:probable rRNA maturation factor
MLIEIDYDDITKLPKEEKLIKKVIETVLKEEKIIRDLEIYVTLTNNNQIHKINLEQRNVDRPTDVLSFPMFEREEVHLLKEKNEEEPDILGDIIISIEKVKEQAEEYGHSFERELAYLTTHGMLHLLGYDHMIEEEKEQMRKREEEILEILNITRE